MRFLRWFKMAYGIKLKKLHVWNAWLVVSLAVTGIILYLPSLRGSTAYFRVMLKDLHIILGVLSVIVLLLYIPLIFRHVKQLRGKLSQQFNLTVVLLLLSGWSVSGIILWQYRLVPSMWITISIFIHDLLTWIGIPWAIFHSVSRSRLLKQNKIKNKLEHDQLQEKPNYSTPKKPSELIQWLKFPSVSRRNFIRQATRWGTGLLLVLSVGPSFYKWLKRALDDGGTTIDAVSQIDGNNMYPPPKPLPPSKPPIGGGLKGNFRVYTVTDIPSSSSEDWSFAIDGLVSTPFLLKWDALLKLPRKVQVSDFHCVTGWSVYQCTWEGIPLSQLLDMAGVDSKAKYVKFYSGDRVYTDSLTLEQARLDDVMVAVLIDGKPIPQKFGGPVKLIVPQMYAYKSVKWLQAIELIEHEHIGYWEARGYDTDAWVRQSSYENKEFNFS